MKHLLSTLALICVALTVITFSITACSEETPDLGRSTKIDLSREKSIEMVKVEAGTFEMSAKDGENERDEVPHQATLTRDFYIGQTEVTQAQWRAVMGTNPSRFKGDDLPVEQVSWNDAMEFCEKLNAMGKAPKGWMFTLPTETQWEYAARGGKKSKGYKYSGSNDVDEVAWHRGNSGSNTHPVGQKKANELGLYDMSGNVFELCLDDGNDDSSKQKAEFTRGNDQGGSKRVNRGGSWSAYAWFCRSSYRINYAPGFRDNFQLGFRLALVQSNNDKTEAKRNASKIDSTTADQGNAEEQYNLGLEYYKKQDYSEAVECFKKAAEQGNAEAQWSLGLCYFSGGRGVTKNQVEAVKWFRKAAEQGHAEAQNELGTCYYNGEGVKKNNTEAVNWWREAAEQGHAEAQLRLGILFYAAENRVEAVKWFRKAADQGNEMAKEALKNLGY